MKRRYGAILLAMAVAAFGAAPTVPQAGMGDLLRRLASEDFATREAAQRELESVPRDQMDALQAASRDAQDPEVKARLLKRVEQLQVEILLHPPGLSLDIDGAGPLQVINAINAQLGSDYLRPASAPAAGKPLTLHVKNQPFWEILRQLNAQSPLVVAPFTPTSVSPENLGWSVGYAAPGTFYDYTLHDPLIQDAFAFEHVVFGTPATGEWTFRMTVRADPRIKMLSVGPLKVDVMTDQDGRDLLPRVHGSETKGLPQRVAVKIGAAPGVREIATLKGRLQLTIAGEMAHLDVDLSKADQQTIEIPHGKVTVEKGDKGAAVYGYATETQPAGSGGRPLPRINVPPENVIRVRTSAGAEYSIVPGERRSISGGASARVLWVSKIFSTAVPIEWKNVRVPENATEPTVPRAAGGAVAAER